MPATPAVFCITCGTALPGRATFCPSCGTATAYQEASEAAAAAGVGSTEERLRQALGDRYRIEKKLGAGGMATVYLAQDIRHDRNVAIKVLHPELAASMGPERFEREIKVAAKLQHPNILGLYDSGVADGLLFYVMPYVEGESLADRIEREKQLPLDDAMGITLEVLDALGYAHKQGIIHRDIKPDNIMLSGGHALVADFGIARAMAAGGGQKLTQTGAAIGTPLYMSPEQAYGEDVGPTADLYSMACVTYEMLTGQPPFTGSTATAIMARHTVEVVPSLRVVRDSIPEEVEEAILVALAKVPADRPQTASKFAELLGTPLGSTSARLAARSRYTTAPRLSQMLKRPPVYRRPVPIAAAVGVIGLITAGWMAFGRGSAASGDTFPVDRIAVLYLDDLTDRQQLGFLADGLTEGLIDALSGVSGLSVVSRSGSAQFRGPGQEKAPIAEALQAGTLVFGSVDLDGGNYRVTLRIAGSDGEERDRIRLSGDTSNLLALSDDLARQGAELVRQRVGRAMGEVQQRSGAGNVDAWVLFQRAEKLRKQADSLVRGGDAAAALARLGSAESLLTRAEDLDARWAEPVVARAGIAYQKSRWNVGDLQAAAVDIESGIGHAGRAIAVDPRHAGALELRGNLQYWKWLLQLETNERRAAALLRNAQADLDSATRINPRQAGAWSTLSHLYNQLTDKSGSDVADAARRALEADAFLSNADVITRRLFFAHYDLGVFAPAGARCAEGRRRFPDSYWFTECALFMMTTPSAQNATVPAAWALRDSVLALTPPSDSAYVRRATAILVAAVVARAARSNPSLADSARAVLRRSRGDALVDPSRDLANLSAFVHTLLGDPAGAVADLRLYLSANPQRRAAFAADPGWWYASIADDPAFRQLVGSR